MNQNLNSQIEDPTKEIKPSISMSKALKILIKIKTISLITINIDIIVKAKMIKSVRFIKKFHLN
jgi:hypothetical protein